MQADAVFGDIVPIPGFSEPVSCLMHLLAAGIVLLGSGWFMKPARGHTSWLWSTGVFVFAAVFLLSMSGVYHLLEPGGEPRAVMQRLDHAAIWVMIAATFTPIHTIACRGVWRWGVLLFVWSVALSGLVIKTVYFETLNELIGLVFYLGLGWVGLVTGYRLYVRHGWRPVALMFAGGLCYSAGAIMEFARWPIVVPHVVGPHELFHLAVVGGLIFHAAVVRWVLCHQPRRTPAADRRPSATVAEALAGTG